MAIAYVTGAKASNTSAGSALTLPSFAAAIHDTILVAVALANTSASVSAITDTALNTYTLQAAISNVGNIRVELWAATNVAANATNVVAIAVTGGTSLIAAVAGQWSGPASPYIGNTATATGSSFTPTISALTQDGGNFFIGALAFVSVSTLTVAASEGISRQSVIPTVTSVGIALVDSGTSNGIGTVPAGAILSLTEQWAAAGLELRTASGTCPYADYASVLPIPITAFEVFAVTPGLNTYLEPLRDEPLNIGSGNMAF
jgi:hypothetical protein